MKLIVDKREPANFRLPLIEMGFKERKLKAGDIIIGSMLIERKGSTQFVTDWFSHQLDWQINNMFKRKKYRPAIILEWEDLSKIQQHLSRLEKHIKKLNWQVLPVLESDSREQTLGWIREQVSDLKKGKCLIRTGIVNPSKGVGRENALRIAAVGALSRFPGIGEQRALAILTEYGNVRNAIKNIDTWHKKVKGIGLMTQNRSKQTVYYKFV